METFSIEISIEICMISSKMHLKSSDIVDLYVEDNLRLYTILVLGNIQSMHVYTFMQFIWRLKIASTKELHTILLWSKRSRSVHLLVTLLKRCADGWIFILKTRICLPLKSYLNSICLKTD